jgi:capsule polysaccharide export protein KpsC/LpsZ
MTSDWWDVSEEWEKVKDIPLDEEQRLKINRYLKTRISHTEDLMVYNFGPLEEREKTLQRFNLDSGKATYTLFTNVLWDAASAQREIAFANAIEWVFETIEWFASHPEKQLIVKIHPAEVVIGTNQPFAELITNRFPALPANVRMIKPDEKVNSWSIYEVTDLGLVHTTTAGMELPLLGIPSIVVSKTHFRGRGFTIDLNSKDAYFDYLSQFKKENVETERSKILAERYAFLLFERYQVPFEVFNLDEKRGVNFWRFNSISELFKIDYFEDIIDSIIKRKAFLTEA